MRVIRILFFLILSSSVYAQEIFRLNQHPGMVLEGRELTSPFSGGINSAQIQTIDLTGDGSEEWVVWDINSRQLQVYHKEGEVFTHLPALSYLFPEDINGFLILVDFNGDGKKDLFTSTPLGIKAYLNTSQGGRISWTVAQNFLRLDGAGNIQANNLDIPLIQDLDGDGDLDLVIFNFAAGDYLEFYKNTSVERKGTADIDGFAFPEVFWGNFAFCGCGEFSFGQTCTGQPMNRMLPTGDNLNIQHAGGHSLLYRDLDGDGVRDLILGRDECSTLYYLPNSGTNISPRFTTSAGEAPGYGAFPRFPLFHIPSVIGDELIISLNTSETAFNFGIDFATSILRVTSEGDQDVGFLQHQSLDLGENSRPFFTGNKNNGQLIVTANVTRDGSVRGEAFRFAFSEGEFTLTDSDVGALSALDLLDVQWISYTDRNAVGHTLVTGIRYTGNIPSQTIFRSTGEGWETVSFTGYVPSRGDEIRFFAYTNRDYMLVAGQNGSLDLYGVDFERMAAELQEEGFLGFVDNPANRNLNVAVGAGSAPDLYAVDQLGSMMMVEDFMGAAVRKEVLVQVDNRNLPTRLGRNTWIALVNPVFGGGADLLLGTRAGGLLYMAAAEGTEPGDGLQLKVYPNPTIGPIRIIANQAATGRLITAMGQVVKENIAIPAHREVEIQAGFLTPGLYILTLEMADRSTVSRKIWVR